MEKIREFFALITSAQYLGWILLGIFIIVIIVTICIVLHYLNKKKKAENDARAYRYNELTSLSDEEVKNIANNVADPEVLYKKLEEHEQQVKAEIEAENIKPATKKKSSNSKKEDGKKDSTQTKKSTKKLDNNEQTKKPTQTKKSTKKVEEVTETTEVKEEPKKPTQTKKSTKKVETAQTETPTPTETTESTTATKKVVYNGKWKIKEEDGKYFAELYASNGVIVLKTEYYTSLNGVKNGIETIKKNVNVGNFATSVDKNGRYCFKLFSKSNRLICISDYYSSKAKCESGINSVKRFAETASVIIEEI